MTKKKQKHESNTGYEILQEKKQDNTGNETSIGSKPRIKKEK